MRAKSRKTVLQGSEQTKGEENYVKDLSDNLFEKMLPSHEDEFTAGNGNELKDGDTLVAKAKALHSSSVFCINIFHYWDKKGELDKLCHALNLCNQGSDPGKNLMFEKKLPIFDSGKTPPNLDVVIENPKGSSIKAYAVECKFSEPYSKREDGKQTHLNSLSKYVQDDSIWEGVPHLKQLSQAKNLQNDYQYLDMPQLVKHLLGLKRCYGKSSFRLLYLWYDVPGEEGWLHRKEIEQFITHTKEDRLKVTAISYQELFARLEMFYMDGNEEYMKYLLERYF